MSARIAAAVLALAAVATAQQPHCARRTAFLTVLDGRGAPIAGVHAADLQISAKPNPALAGFSATAGRARVALLVDASGSLSPSSTVGQAARAEALAFARWSPVDRMALIVFSSAIRLTAGFGVPAGRDQTLIRRQHAYGPTALYDTVQAAVRAMRGTGTGASIVVVSDGLDDYSRASASQAAAEAAAAGVRIFLVLPPHNHAADMSLGQEGRRDAKADALTLTRRTGGFELAPSGHFDRMARGLWRVIEQGYLLRLRLERPRTKPLRWKIRLTRAFRRSHARARLLYPSPLPACAPPQAARAGPR